MTLKEEVEEEFDHAVYSFPPFSSMHEAYAVLLEEVDELWDEVKASNFKLARREAIQVAAMAMRFVKDLDNMRES